MTAVLRGCHTNETEGKRFPRQRYGLRRKWRPKIFAAAGRQSADMLENPADAGTARGRGAGDDELLGRMRAAFAVDPQAFLDVERALRGAEWPQRTAVDAEQRAELVGGEACRQRGAEVEAQHERLVALAAAARGGEQLVLAAQFAPVGRQDQQAAVDQAMAAGVAVVAHLQTAALRRLAPVELDLGDPLAERPARQDRGRIAIGEGQGPMRPGGTEPAREGLGDGGA